MTAGRKAGRGVGSGPGHLKQLGLFVLTVLLPACALVFLSLRTISQERELARTRARDDRERAARDFGQELLAELERLKGSVGQSGPAAGTPLPVTGAGDVHVVGWVEADALKLPWEVVARPGRDGESPFDRLVREAERAELVGARYADAAGTYRLAAAAGQTPAEQGLARLGLGRCLSQLQGNPAEELRLVTRLPPEVCDEFGVPLAFYAAGLLAKSGDPSAAVTAVGAAVESRGALSPAALYMARGLLREVIDAAPEDLLRRLDGRITDAERAKTLKADFAAVRTGLGARDGTRGRWVLYGDWLLAHGGADASGPTPLCAADADVVCRRVFQERGFGRLGYESATLLRPGEGGEGAWLGEAFPNLRVNLLSQAAPDGSAPSGTGMHWALVCAVLGSTLFGSYLWWRDLRRELRLAGLRSDFVAGVSHELKTPLTSIRMFAETLRFRQASEARRNEYLDTILAETERLGRLLANVLDFSRIERGARRYDLRPAELGEVVEASVRAMRQPLGEGGFELELRLPPRPVPLRADRDALEQAVVNLLANAIKYSGAARRIEVEAAEAPGGATVVVRDHGAGIHPREHLRIFERYYRAPEARDANVPGTGLGLSLVKHIVEGHRGRVAVESSPGKGAAFTIWLPTGVGHGEGAGHRG